MKRARVLAIVLLPTALALLGSVPALSASLSFSPPAVVLDVAEKLIVEVLVSDVPNTETGLAYFRFDLVFDPTVVRILDPNAGWGGQAKPFEPLGGNVFCAIIRDESVCSDPQWFLTSTGRAPVADYFPFIPDPIISIDNAVGRARIGYLTVEFGLPDPASVLPSGTGALAVLEIERIAPGSTSILFENVIVEGTRYYHPTNLLDPLTASSVVTFATTTACLSFQDSQEPVFDCDTADSDGDGILDPSDNCLAISNNNQDDNDSDGVGDACDQDDDNDGINDAQDNDSLLANNFCSGVDAYIFSEMVDEDLVCAATASITVVPLAEVLASGNLRLIAPFLSFEPDFIVAGSLAITSADPCPGCIVGPTITIESPFDGTTVSESPIAVTGLLAPGVEAVSVNGVPALIGGGGYFIDVPVTSGANTITAVASDAAGIIGTTSVRVTFSQ